MKISSEQLNNLLAYAKERHGAPCRVEVKAAGIKINGEEQIECMIYYRYSRRGDAPWPEPVERILI